MRFLGGMRSLAMILLTSLLAAGSVGFGQQPEPPASPESGGQAAEPDAPLPRVVGQAQSQEELDAWSAIEAASDLASKEKLAKEFFATYPDSGLTAYVHYSLASAYRRADRNEEFIGAAEKALAELPSLPEVSSYLAFLRAETGRADEAERWANQTLTALRTMGRPANVSAADWARAQRRSRGDAHYALGRVELGRAMALKDPEASRQALLRSAEHFVSSMRDDPRNPYASFRLASVYRNLNQPEEAIEAYARTAALGGVIEPYARKNLLEIYEFLGRDPAGAEEAIARQKRHLDEELANLQRELDQLEQVQQPDSDETEPMAKPPY